MESCDDQVTIKQLCLMLGRQRSNWNTDNEDLQKIISYETFNEHFMSLARELDVVNPKAPEQVFKSHLEEKKPDEAKLDSHKVNLSVTYANAFINAGFSSDTIMMKEGNDELEWVFKNKDYGQIASVASVGMLLLWNIDAGFEKIDKYMDHNNDLIRAGSYIAVGLVNSGIKNINDPVFALLQDKLDKNQFEKVGALMGLSLTYAGSNRQDII